MDYLLITVLVIVHACIGVIAFVSINHFSKCTCNAQDLQPFGQCICGDKRI